MDEQPEGRRARTRAATLAALHDAALAEIREHGAVALSLRRVARRMGMSPAGLYRYVVSREDLLTRLIADAYDDLADHLEAVHDAEADLVEQLVAVAHAYRSWAVAHPQEFALLFGDPIPGYQAPPGGVTVAAMQRVGAALGRPLLAASAAGRLRPIPVAGALADGLSPMADLGPGAEDPSVAATLLLTWGRLHGQVSLEVFGHHDWLFPDGCADLYALEVDTLRRQLVEERSY